MQVLHDVSKYVEAYEIEGAKGRSLWPADGGPRDLVDLFDRVDVVEHCANRMQRAESADAIRNKVRPILRDNNSLAESFIEKAKHRTGDFRLGPFGPNQLDQMHVSRRIEEVHAEEVRPKIFRPSFSELAQRDTAGVGSNDRAWLPILLDSFVQAAFDFKVLDNGFNDQIVVL